MTRSFHPPMAHCNQRVRFAATWREEFFEVPLTLSDVAGLSIGANSLEFREIGEGNSQHNTDIVELLPKERSFVSGVSEKTPATLRIRNRSLLLFQHTSVSFVAPCSRVSCIP
jgi:hypothetical protein